jgi:hypothetical protein
MSESNAPATLPKQILSYEIDFPNLLLTLHPKDINFSQASISTNFRSGPNVSKTMIRIAHGQ